MSFDAYTTAGQGQNLFQQLPIQSTRDPVNQVDYNDPTGGPYQIGRRWFNKTNANYWHYIGQGTWVLDAGDTGAILGVGVPAGNTPIFADADGLINFTSSGGTVTISGSAGGLGAQDINFDVSGTVVVSKFAVDAATAPGTNPVLPSGGQVTIEGGTTYATGTRIKPIRTNSLAASTIDLEIQLAGNNAATASTTKFGVAQFDANQFDVTSGFVQLKGGGTNPSLTKLGVDYGTNNPVVPDATGKLNLIGGTVAAGTNPVRTDGTGANTAKIEVQTSQAIAATDATKIGLAAFNSAQFSVDANGFVSTLSSGTFSSVVRQVFTSSGTYTPTSGMKYCDVEIVGGGAGGGGSAAVAGGQASGGGGGAGGGYSRKIFSAATIGGSKSVTIGAGGAGGAAGGATGSNGTAGGTTSFDALISATGGGAGQGGLASGTNGVTAVRSIPGVGSGGDFNTYGGIGEGSFGWSTLAYAGNGGSSFYGTGGAVNGSSGGVSGVSNIAYGYGSGGGGGSAGDGATARAGASGLSGICIITEYCG